MKMLVDTTGVSKQGRIATRKRRPTATVIVGLEEAQIMLK